MDDVAIGSVREVTSIPDASTEYLIERPGVSARIEQLTDGRVAEVTGPAGSGKTTALRMWSGRTEVGAVAWLTAESRHRDTLVLARALADAVRYVAPLDDGTFGAEPMGIVDSLADQIRSLGRRMVVVIDNVEKLDGAPSLGVIRRLVSTEHDSLRMVVAGRMIPDIGFAELRSRGELITAGADRLRLTTDETSQLVRVASRKQLDDRALLAIHREVDGWAMGARLAGLALSTSPDPTGISMEGIAGHRLFDRYFGSEVFDGLPGDLQAFLLETSVLNVLDPDLCTEITARVDAESVLWGLERGNLFTEWLGGSPPEFRYHSVLRSWLRARLRQTQPSRRDDLLRRAATWCQRHERPSDAIEYWLAADDHAAAAELIIAYGPRALSEGRYESTRTWVRALPGGLIASNTPLLRLLADAEHRLGNTEGATAAWVLMRELATRRPEAEEGHALTIMVQRGTDLGRRGHLLAAAAQARRCLAMIDLSRPESGAQPPPCEDPDLAMNLASIASQLMFAGHWSECAQVSRWVVDSCSAGDPTMATARARCLGQEAITQLIVGSRTAAEALAAEAIALCRFHGLDPLDLGYAELAMLVAGRDTDRTSLHAILEERDAQLNMASHSCLVGLMRAWAYVQTGDLDDARRMLAVAESAMARLSEPGVLVALSGRIRSIVEAGTDEPILRPRELEVLRLIARGASRREAAEKLHLSVNTVKTYARLAYRALGVNTLDAAVVKCEALGIRLEPEPVVRNPPSSGVGVGSGHAAEAQGMSQSVL